MTTEFIHDRGRGPEIAGTRVTVDSLLSHFLDPDVTEALICQLYDLTPEQVAAARAYVFTQPDVVLEKCLQGTAGTTPKNPPEVVRQAEKTRAALLSFKEWLAQRESSKTRDETHANGEEPAGPDSRTILTFKEWLAERALQAGDGR